MVGWDRQAPRPSHRFSRIAYVAKWWPAFGPTCPTCVRGLRSLACCRGLPQGTADRLRAAQRTGGHGKRQRHGRVCRDVRSGRASRLVLEFALAAAGSGRLRRLVPRRLPAAQPGRCGLVRTLVAGQAAPDLDLRRPRFRRRPVVLAENPTRGAGRPAGGDCRASARSGTCLSVGPAPKPSTATCRWFTVRYDVPAGPPTTSPAISSGCRTSIRRNWKSN